jgi:hypothetical protein
MRIHILIDPSWHRFDVATLVTPRPYSMGAPINHGLPPIISSASTIPFLWEYSFGFWVFRFLPFVSVIRAMRFELEVRQFSPW